MKPTHLAHIKSSIKHIFESFQEGQDQFIAFFYNEEHKTISWITDTKGFEQKEISELDTVINQMVNPKSHEQDIYIYHCSDNLEIAIEETPTEETIDDYEASDIKHLYIAFD